MKYVAYVSHNLCPKNKLEAAVQQFIISHDRILLDESEIKDFQTRLNDGVLELNNKFPRCAPLSVEFWQHRIKFAISKLPDNDYSLIKPNFVQLLLLACAEKGDL